jgi:N-acetyl-D-muramate 6-phosphate phosphatase
MRGASPRWRAVLFDLDGTLIDSAPDLGGTGNDLRARRGLPPLPLSDFRPHTGSGARGLLAVALGVTPADPNFESLKEEFLSHYQTRMARDTHVFAGMGAVLDRLEAQGIAWGIVTNKATRFARPLTEALALHKRASVLVCGDTTPRAKPHPDPLLAAAAALDLPPAACLYVGDDLRDIQAGRSAGMATAAAAWGYLGAGDPLETWQADHILETPEDLLSLAGVD